MNWIRTVRRKPFFEVALVVLLTVAVTLFTVTAHVTDNIQALQVHQGVGTDLADYGPGLLVLSVGLGMMAYRRWKDSERERKAHDAASSARARSEARYRSLVEVSPDPVLVVGEMRILYANPAAVTFFHADAEGDLVGRGVLDLLPRDFRGTAPAWFASVLASAEHSAPVEGPLVRLDGTTVDAETVLVRTPYEGGYAVQAVVRDLSARRAAEEADTRYQALAENSEEIVFFSAPDGRIVDCNRAAVLRYGWTKEELTAMTVYGLREPGSRRPVGVELTHVAGDTARFDTVHAIKNGSLIYLNVTAQRFGSGDDEFVLSVCHDVTEKRQADLELAESAERYRSLIDLSPSPVIVYDAARTIVFANQATLELLRARDMSQLIGRDAQDFISPESRSAATESVQTLREAGSIPFIDMRLLRFDGTSVAVQMATSRTTYNGADAYQSVAQDVSRLQDIAANLKRTTEHTIAAMARLAEVRDPYTSGHQERVAMAAFRIGQRMGLSESTCETIRLAGIVHDIGKMNVPAEILSKPGRLNEAEFALIKEHAQRGYDLLVPIDFPWPIAEIVREHHERLDGSGYPRGLEDGAICIEARVIAVADTVEAISSHRPYRPSLGIEHALDVIREGRGRLYDAAVVDAALELAKEGKLLDADTTSDSVWPAA